MRIIQKAINEAKTEETTEIKEIPFADGYTLQIFPSLNKTVYLFKDPKGFDAAKYKGIEPLMLTERLDIGKEILKHIGTVTLEDGRSLVLDKKTLIEDFETIKSTLNEHYQMVQIQKDKEDEDSRAKEEQLLKQNLNDAKSILECKDQPILYIAALTSWLTAGERANIMLTFITYASQVILRNPISMIGLGEASSGKTHIQEVALSLMPNEFVLNEKKITEAALFRRAETDPYYYDGKIVNFGDLGGKNSQEFIMEVKDLLKELQSDGYLNKPLMVPSQDGGFDIKELELFGTPCITYTTIPGHIFDDQEKSRSIFYAPRTDNKKVFDARKNILELQGGRSFKKCSYYQKEVEIVQYMVRLLRERMDDIQVVNPYTESVINFLGESEYFKRDFDKYNGILKTITVLNGYNREPFDINGHKTLFTTLADIQLFISLLTAYHESISVNITPKAAEVLDEIRANMDTWKNRLNKENVEQDIDRFVTGITVNDFVGYSKLKLQKRSVQNYFGELNAAGFIKVVERINNANVYALSGKISEDLSDKLLQLSDEHKQLISLEYDPIVLRFIEEDFKHDGLSILLNDPTVDSPPWDSYDH